MIALWIAFYVGHIIGFNIDAWWAFPFWMTTALAIGAEFVLYVHLFVKN